MTPTPAETWAFVCDQVLERIGDLLREIVAACDDVRELVVVALLQQGSDGAEIVAATRTDWPECVRGLTAATVASVAESFACRRGAANEIPVLLLGVVDGDLYASAAHVVYVAGGLH